LNVFISWRTATDSLLGDERKEGKGNEGRADEATGDDSHLARKTIGSDMSNKKIFYTLIKTGSTITKIITIIERSEAGHECWQRQFCQRI
jgi:hypothetical protein